MRGAGRGCCGHVTDGHTREGRRASGHPPSPPRGISGSYQGRARCRGAYQGRTRVGPGAGGRRRPSRWTHDRRSRCPGGSRAPLDSRRATAPAARQARQSPRGRVRRPGTVLRPGPGDLPDRARRAGRDGRHRPDLLRLRVAAAAPGGRGGQRGEEAAHRPGRGRHPGGGVRGPDRLRAVPVDAGQRRAGGLLGAGDRGGRRRGVLVAARPRRTAPAGAGGPGGAAHRTAGRAQSGASRDAGAAQPGGPSWWRDPLVKDGTTGPVGSSGYLWGPDDDVAPAAAPAEARERVRTPAAPRGGIGGRLFVLAVLAGGVATASVWHGSALGHALQIGLATTLAVFGLGLLVSSLKGRTGFGTVLLAMITAGLLAGASALPREIGTDWRYVEWRPAAVQDVRPAYEAGTGLATLDLSRLDVPKGATLKVRAGIDAGRLKVIVPREVTARADIGIRRLGDVQLPGEREGDVRVRSGGEQRQVTLPPAAGTEAGGTIELHLAAGVGQVEVARAAS
ncbi:integral membrane protein [Streptomyces sp. Mg1]|nr:integral membrane protein [Streptomyces sp. Mg1]